jgi:hypothetical protein
MKNALTEYARAGYDGNENPHIKTSPAWYAHVLGEWLHHTGRMPPKNVRMGRGYQIHANDMLFAFGKNNEITRIK